MAANKKSDGGSAFPMQPVGVDVCEGSFGMSLRDYFAAKAMQALIIAKTPQGVGDQRGWPIGAEKDAWLIADAMLAERNK